MAQTTARPKYEYEVVVTEQVKWGGKPITYWVYAYHENQAKAIVAERYNRERGFERSKFVKLYIKSTTAPCSKMAVSPTEIQNLLF